MTKLTQKEIDSLEVVFNYLQEERKDYDISEEKEAHIFEGMEILKTLVETAATEQITAKLEVTEIFNPCKRYRVLSKGLSLSMEDGNIHWIREKLEEIGCYNIVEVGNLQHEPGRNPQLCLKFSVSDRHKEAAFEFIQRAADEYTDEDTEKS